MVSVVEGAIVLELEGRPPVEVGAGQAMMEPMDTALRGVHANATQLAKLILFDVAAPRMPFEVTGDGLLGRVSCRMPEALSDMPTDASQPCSLPLVV
jgi:hypothetical protein